MRDLPERKQTLVQAAFETLSGERWWTLRELSAALGVTEKGLPEVLEKVARRCHRVAGCSLERRAPSCVACGFEFAQRTRASKPSRCPRCRSERVALALYRVLRGS